MSGQTIDELMAASRARLRQRLAEKGLPRLSPEEYRAAQQAQLQKLNEQEQRQTVIDYARLGLREQDLQLDWNFIKRGGSDGYKALQTVKEAYDRGWGMVFLWGTYGQAKTLIGKIMTVQAFHAGKKAAYANMSTVLDDIRLAYDEEEHKTTELIRRMDWWLQRDVLFIDEIDRCNSTPWALERMFQLIDGRYVKAIREEGLTVMASNKGTNELDGYIKSRLADRRLGPIVYLNGPDGRASVPDNFKW